MRNLICILAALALILSPIPIANAQTMVCSGGVCRVAGQPVRNVVRSVAPVQRFATRVQARRVVRSSAYASAYQSSSYGSSGSMPTSYGSSGSYSMSYAAPVRAVTYSQPVVVQSSYGSTGGTAQQAPPQETTQAKADCGCTCPGCPCNDSEDDTFEPGYSFMPAFDPDYTFVAIEAAPFTVAMR